MNEPIKLPPLPEWADMTLQGEDRYSLFAWAEEAIEADRQTTNKQLVAYKRITESLESRIVLLQNQYDELKKTTDPSLLASERAANALLTEEVEALKADRQALRDVLERCRIALEPYDDVKPRDWKTDREKLRYAHQAVCAALESMEK